MKFEEPEIENSHSHTKNKILGVIVLTDNR